jgi:putative heme-binding domain-containing protein
VRYTVPLSKASTATSPKASFPLSDVQFSVPVAEMQAVGVRPTRGDFGLPEAAIIKPGEPYASTFYFRMAKFGRDRMPHIGSEWPDEAGLMLIEQWIARMNGTVRPAEARLEAATPDQLASPQSAMPLARKLGRGQLNTTKRDALLTAVSKLPSGPVRDLFEGYLPVGPKGVRKLGSNPRPSIILGLQGDADRGEKLFWSQAINCGKCHRIGDRGTPAGPDLTNMGKLRSTEDLLESLLSPSRRIEPKYAAYLLNTADGRTLTGLLIKREEQSIVLRDNEGKEIALPAESVEELRPLRTSLMPDGQLADLTGQEAADLLEYLALQKSESFQIAP